VDYSRLGNWTNYLGFFVSAHAARGPFVGIYVQMRMLGGGIFLAGVARGCKVFGRGGIRVGQR
jgi:hypothetical protein